jgi:hypothetical protein
MPLMLASWLFIGNHPIQWSLTHSKKTGVLSVLRGISVTLLVALMFAFVKIWAAGIMGLVFAMIIVNAVTIVIGYRYAQKHFAIDLPYRRLIAAASIISAGGLMMIAVPSDTSQPTTLLINISILAIVIMTALRASGLGSLWKLIRPKEW